MVRRLLKADHRCVVFDRSRETMKELVQEKAVGAASLPDFVKGYLADDPCSSCGQDDRRPFAGPAAGVT